MARLHRYNKDFLIIATVAISAVLILGLFVMPFSGAVPTPQPAYTYGGDAVSYTHLTLPTKA